jgi:ribosomal protein S18 acetylase RimI-like enzyme
MPYYTERLTTIPTEPELEDIAVLTDYLTARVIPRDALRENVTEIVQNPSQLFYVARDALHIVGMELLTLKTLPHERTAYADSLIVHPDHRRRGLGRQLWQCATGYADTYGITLQGATSPRRTEAWGLHQQVGFRQWDSRFIVRQPESE